MSEFYIPDAATLQAERINLTANAFLAREGFDPANAQPINAPKIIGEAFEVETIYEVERHTGQPEEIVPAPDDDFEARDDIEGVKQALEVAMANVKAHPADGDNILKLALVREAFEIHRELEALMADTVREKLDVHAIYSGGLAADMLRGDFHGAHERLCTLVKDDNADAALKIAGVKSIIEIAPLSGADNGEDFDGAWLAKTVGIPLRTAQDLITLAHSLESGIASMLVGTEGGGRKGLRALAKLTPARRRKAVEALKEHLTLSLLEFAAKREKARRTRSISLSELDALDAIGLNNREGRKALTEQSVKDGKQWLATALDKLAAAERRHGERAEPRGCDARVNGRRVLPSLTMQRLRSERVYEL
jgi:hypothetical protein